MSRSNKKQHFVPACYLKAWLDTHCLPNHMPYVWVFDKNGSNPRRKAPSNLFTETDLYTIQKFDGSRDLSIEHGLAELESKFTIIRKSKFNFNRDLTLEQRAYICTFVAAAQFRTTSSRDHHSGQWSNIAARADELKIAMDKATPEQKKAYSRIVTPSSTKGSLTHEQVKQLAKSPIQLMMPPIIGIVTPILMKMHMAILCTDDPVGFITSDNPCVWYDPESYKLPPLYRSPALFSKTIEVTMPISPKQCLLFNWQNLEGYQNIDSNVLDSLNLRHRVFCDNNYIVNVNSKNEAWFDEPPMPEDAWEKVNPSK